MEMAPTVDAGRARVRVLSARVVSPIKGTDRLSAGVVVNCAVGEVVEVQDSALKASSSDRVIWSQGGARHDPAHLESDGSAQCCWIDVSMGAVRRIPQSMSDNVALRANDMAAAIHVTRVVVARQLMTIAIVATSAVIPLTHLIMWRLQQVSNPLQTPRVHVKVLDEVSGQAHIMSWPLTPATIPQSEVFDDGALFLDCCIDLCCTDASLDFATNQLEPLGTLILLASDPQASSSSRSTAINMNAVVVNELNLVSVGDFQDEMSEAIEVLTTHAAGFTTVAGHVADSDSVLYA
jgi:hypothetical protein